MKSLSPSLRLAFAVPVVLLVLLGPARRSKAQEGGTWLSGVTAPVSDAELSAPVAGVLGKYHFKEGDRVNKGDVILELENARQRLEVQRNRLIVDAARKDYERTKKLFEDGKGISVSREEFDQKAVALKVALADLEIAEEELSQRLIAAPFAGRIVDFFQLETGEGVRAQTPIVRIVDVGRCVMVCDVPPAEAASLVEGDEVEVRAGKEGRGEALPGKIVFISSVLEPTSGLLKIKAQFENKGNRVKPGFAAIMRVTGKKAEKEGQANAR